VVPCGSKSHDGQEDCQSSGPTSRTGVMRRPHDEVIGPRLHERGNPTKASAARSWGATGSVSDGDVQGQVCVRIFFSFFSFLHTFLFLSFDVSFSFSPTPRWRSDIFSFFYFLYFLPLVRPFFFLLFSLFFFFIFFIYSFFYFFHNYVFYLFSVFSCFVFFIARLLLTIERGYEALKHGAAAHTRAKARISFFLFCFSFFSSILSFFLLFYFLFVFKLLLFLFSFFFSIIILGCLVNINEIFL
jgi:hypothetical protein